MRVDGWLRFVLWPGILGLFLFLLIVLGDGGERRSTPEMSGIILQRLGIGGSSPGIPPRSDHHGNSFPGRCWRRWWGLLAVAGAVYRDPAQPWPIRTSWRLSGAPWGGVGHSDGWAPLTSAMDPSGMPLSSPASPRFRPALARRLLTDMGTIIPGVVVQAFSVRFSPSPSPCPTSSRSASNLADGRLSLRGWDHVGVLVPFLAIGLLISSGTWS